MRDFGTFDTISDEEDTIYNRLALIKRKLNSLELEHNEVQQDIKMWRNKMMDDKFKVKMWLTVTLICVFLSVMWMFLPKPDAAFTLGGAYIINVILTFLALVGSYVMYPLSIIFAIVTMVLFCIHTLRNNKSDRVIRFAKNIGVTNRNVLIDEKRELVKGIYTELESLREEEEELKKQLEKIKKEKI